MSWQERDFEGFYQAREVVPGHRPGRWRFYVLGFGDTECTVYRADKSRQRVPIDARNRITINGRKYGPAHYAH